MDKGLDTGNIIYQQSINIDNDETYRSLYDKLSIVAYDMLIKYVDNLFNEHLISIKQNDKLSTYAPTISANDEKID
jgi:methionyl-tRNA formyltransferase